jgi:predicted porin
MKKTLVALAVLTAASSAQAFVVYDQDKITVDLKGDIELQYQNTFDSSSMKQEIEDADFGFDVRYMINDEWTVGGYWEFNGSTSTNATNAEAGDTFVAAYSKTLGSLKVGRLCTAIDDAGTAPDEVFGLLNFNTATSPCEDEGIRYDYDNGQVYATLGFFQDKHASQSLTDDSNYYDARLGYRVSDFDLSVFLAEGEALTATDSDPSTPTTTDGTNTTEDKLSALEVIYNGFENLRLEAGYYASDRETKAVSGLDSLSVGDNFESKTIAVGANYTWGLYNFGAGYSSMTTDTNWDSSSDEDYADKSQWLLNARYQVAPTASIYVEVAGRDIDFVNVDNDTALAIGAEASF